MSAESPFIKSWSFIYPRTDLEAGYIRLDEAARALGLTRSMVRHLVVRNILDGECRVSRGRRYWTLSRFSVTRLLDQFGPFYNLRLASKRLRMPAQVLKFLVCQKVIPTFGEKSSCVVLSEHDLKEFIKLLDQRTVQRTRHAVPMAKLFSRHSPQARGTMAKIVSGIIPIYRNADRNEPQNVLDFSFGAVSLSCNCETIDIHAAARRLGVNPRMVTTLTGQGLISTSRGGSSWSRGRVSTASVSAFRRRYVLGREVARSLRSSSRQAIARLRVAGVKPVIEPDSRRGISSVWERSDIEKLASG